MNPPTIDDGGTPMPAVPKPPVALVMKADPSDSTHLLVRLADDSKPKVVRALDTAETVVDFPLANPKRLDDGRLVTHIGLTLDDLVVVSGVLADTATRLRADKASR
jgi:hypothetical protein